MRQDLDAVVGGSLQRPAHRFGAGAMTGDARQAALLRPAAVAVHDDRDVARDAPLPPAASPAGALLGGGCGGHLPRISFSLVVARLVDLLDRVVGQLLHFVLEALALVLADLVLLLVGLEVIHPVAADVADRDPRLLGILADELGQLLAALLGQLGDRQADHLAVGDRVEPETGRADRLLDRPTLERSHTCTDSMRGSGADTVATWFSGMLRAVNLDLDRIEQRGRRAPGAQTRRDRASAHRWHRACGA